MKTLTPPLKWHGGKGAFHGKLAAWIISKMPPHLHYVEPYFGGGAVLLARDPNRNWFAVDPHAKLPSHEQGCSEVVCDLHSGLTNFWRVLQNGDQFAVLRLMLEATQFNQADFKRSVKYLDTRRNVVVKEWNFCDLDYAYHFFVACRQSLAGRMKSFAPITRNRTRSRMNEQASAWLGAVDGLPEVHQRLRSVVVLEPQDALNVIRKQDDDKTLFYLDPPYLDETRAAKKVYEYEMTAQAHAELLAVLDGIKGKFLLSGYHSELYDQHAQSRGWTCHEFDIVNNSAGGKKKRTMTECLWSNT